MIIAVIILIQLNKAGIEGGSCPWAGASPRGDWVAAAVVLDRVWRFAFAEFRNATGALSVNPPTPNKKHRRLYIWVEFPGGALYLRGAVFERGFISGVGPYI